MSRLRNTQLKEALIKRGSSGPVSLEEVLFNSPLTVKKVALRGKGKTQAQGVCTVPFCSNPTLTEQGFTPAISLSPPLPLLRNSYATFKALISPPL